MKHFVTRSTHLFAGGQRSAVVALSMLAVLSVGRGCADVEGAGADPSAQWREAQAMWERRDVRAWEAWREIDPDTPEGREARERLARADAHYREGIERLESGQEGVREALSEGVRIAPMDPRLYLPLAREYRERGLGDRAAEYYLKFLAGVPSGPEADAARRELRSLEPGLADVFAPEPTEPAATADGGGESLTASLPVAVLAALALVAAISLIVVARARRGLPLDRLIAQHPELHPAIAYLIGSLRHELLKHRIGAVGDAVRALEAGAALGPGAGAAATSEQLGFLRSRLYGGEPLREAWRAHLRSFDRALGFRLDVRRDPAFRSGGRAIAAIAKQEERVLRGDRRVIRKLAAAHAQLRELDRHLAGLVRRLVRTRIDRALLSGIVDEIRSEYEPGRVALDELSVSEPDEVVEVEVFRIDLALVLKNVVRNAILAVAAADPPRRVAIDVQVDLEPTGDEIVRIRVRDTSAQAPSADTIRGRSVDRGLGLVTAALSRYDGSIDVESGGDGYEKSVTLRFFRALDGADDLQEAA